MDMAGMLISQLLCVCQAEVFGKNRAKRSTEKYTHMWNDLQSSRYGYVVKLGVIVLLP
jgi:hypothetical protein